jgi:hypothetical protein
VARAFLVLGGESTGTRLVTRLCILNGAEGDDDHEQRWDEKLPTPAEHPCIVWRRSIPHGGEGARHFPDPAALVQKLEGSGYEVTVRCWRATVKSQVAQKHVASEEEGLENLRRAYLSILPSLWATGAPVHFVSYEALRDERAQLALFRTVDFQPENVLTLAVSDENSKHYRA